MPSPFPGMNPWLEQEGLWQDFHTRFLVVIRERLVPQVGPCYYGILQYHIYHPAPDLERVPYLEVRHAALGDLVTVVEMLSPSNKQGDNRRQYLTKRDQLLASRTHLVEVDLLRGGEPMPDADRPDCDYSVMVSRAENRPRAGFWPVKLREPLPTVPVPLRRDDGEVHVDLQEALQHVYDASGYENFIYRGAPSPPLSAGDAEWARQFVPATSR